MLSVHRLSQRLVRWTSLFMSSTLLLSAVAIIPSKAGKKPLAIAKPNDRSGKPAPAASQGKREPAPKDNGKKVDPAPPERGAPQTVLPNLDQVRRRKPEKPEAPRAIPSTMRSRRKSGALKEKAGNTSADRTGLGVDRLAKRSNFSRDIQRTANRAHHARTSSHDGAVAFLSLPPQSGGSLTNLALNKPATQSSTYQGAGGATANLAVDGNTSGNWWPDYSVSSTNADPQAWWQADLGVVQSIQNVEVWNRTDCCGERLTNFNVLLLDANQNVVSNINIPGQAGSPTTVQISGSARYVKIQLAGTNYLSLAEVKVWGTPNANAGLTGQYFDNMDFTNLKLTRTDPSVNFDWGGGSPDSTIGPDTFSVRWTGKVQARYSETYTFYTVSDDGVRLWINDQLLIDNWTDHAPTENSGQITLTAGQWYNIRMDFYENGGGAMATLSWSSASQAKEIIPQSQLSPSSGTSGGGSNQELNLARLDPFNQTGNQLQARDCEWSLPLVGLPGRAGLDLGLNLSYSSLVWTRAGNSIYFDADNGTPSPGFRLGFPTIGDVFFDTQANVNARLMVTSSGRRVEFRKLGNFGSYDLYEAGDSSYLQLLDYGSSIWLRTTDGTQMNFAASGGEWHCVLIRDRNGNMINAGYNGYGDITSVTDTLGRVINFNYDTNANLQSITQSWNGQTHTWATFGWGDPLIMHPSFSGVSVIGTQDNEQLAVLRQVGLDDGSRYNFEYTDRGQVNVIRRYTSDNVQRSYVAYNYESPADDCPRISASRVWAENWSDLYGVPHEVVTTFEGLGNGLHKVIAPDGTVYKETYGTGWQRGLVIGTEVRVNNVPQKWTVTTWTQDNTSVSYQTNPRVIEMIIDDAAGNHRRTTINYDHLNYAQYGLPFVISEFGGIGGQPELELRRTYTDYNLSQEYVDWHIIGLVSSVYVYDPATGQWQAKTTYGYDNSALIDPQATTATQHDQSFNASFLVRGNLTSVSRWDASDIENGPKALTAQMAYDAGGSMIYTRDPLNHVASFHYGDWFSDGYNHNTFAYATTVTDPDGNSSSAQFNYDFGARTRVQGPPPANQQSGIIQTIAYDDAARVERVTLNNNAYTRYIYDVNSVHQYSTVNNAADEAYAARFFDGAGHLIFDEGNHPGSAGLYRAVYIIYDAMGRAVKQSNPTEITPNAVPTGDDAAGWLYTTQTYDWKGRPLVTTNPDGWQRFVSYTGCGCAGGEATTMTDEAGRSSRTTIDVLGRLVKTEELNWNGSVYSTANYAYNALDQITSINHEGQVRSFGYDGYGRLQTRTTPEQGTTTYAYNTDDTVLSMTDARGAAATYGYNNRHLTTSINYSAPSGVAATPTVTFGYDAAGNRTSMNDGLGQASYAYDSLSQMTSETRAFNGVGSYQLSYGYNLAGELTGMTNPWNVWTGYIYDSNGRLNRVNADGAPQNVTYYAYDIKYRAFGAVKSMSFGDHQSLSASYDERMRPTSVNVSNVLGYNYSYFEHTERVSYAQNIYDPTLDRSYNYDQVGALGFARSGAEARATFGLGPWYIQDGPYSHQYDYDQFGNMTYRHGWGGEVQGGAPYGGDTDKVYTYSNGKNQRDGFSYDAAGNLRNDLAYAYEYDSIGQQVSAASNGYVLLQGYDGDGLRAQKIDNGAMTLYIRSTVLGGAVVAEIDSSGNWSRGYVYQGDQLLAIQSGGQLSWVHQDAITKSQRVTDVYGNVINTVELDPWGANTNRSSASAFQPQNFTTYIRDGNGDQDASARRYSVGGRFSQPDPYGGSYNFGDPQSLNRYAYVGNDPVNRSDPSGMMWDFPEAYWGFGHFANGFWGAGYLGGNGWGSDPHPGLGIIQETEKAWDITLRRHRQGGREGFSRNWTSDFDPQNPAPDKYIPEKYKKPFNAALTEAEKRLGKDDCAKLFGRSSADLIAMLQNTEYRYLALQQGGPKYDTNTNTSTVTGAQTNSATSVFINSKGPFFNNRMFVPGAPHNPVMFDFNSGLTGAPFGALLLLHELGHQVGLFGPDAGNDKVNREHTRRVQKACF